MSMSFQIKPDETVFYLADHDGYGSFRFYRSIKKAVQMRGSDKKYWDKRGFPSRNNIYEDTFSGYGPIYEVTLTWRELTEDEINAK